MYYCLSPEYSLCSWQGLPYGVREVKSGKTVFMHDQDTYMLLYKCNGKTDFDTLELTEKQKSFLTQMEAQKLLIAYPEAHPLSGAIPSRIYSCRYRSSIHWSITGRCNYRCRHCFQSAEKGELGQPTLEQIYETIDQFTECGITEVSITGGEPLIRSDFFDIIDALIAHGIRVTTIYSNGALVNQKLVDNLKARGMTPSFQISFDGVGFHDWMRGVPGAEENAVRAIKLLKENGFPVACALALCRDNVPSLLETAKLLESLGCSSMKVQRCFPQGEWRMEESHYIGDDELLEIYMQFVQQLCHAGVHMTVQMEGVYMVSYGPVRKHPGEKPGQEQKPEQPEEGEKAPDQYQIGVLVEQKADPEQFKKMPSCGVTWSCFFVGPNGAVVPCMNMCGAAVESIFPNMWKTPLKNILADSSYVQYSEAKRCQVVEHNPECRDCEFRYRCGGGKCRAMAIGDQKTDYLCLDEFTCYLFKSGWVEKLEDWARQVLEETEAAKAAK